MDKKNTSKQRLSSNQRRDLDIEIGFLEGVVRRDPQYVDALQLLGDDYTRRGKFEEGLRMDETLAVLRPDDSLVHYNLACSYSLTARFEQATASLEKAIALGYRDFKWLNEDPDLEDLRRNPAFHRIEAKLRSLEIKVH